MTRPARHSKPGERHDTTPRNAALRRAALAAAVIAAVGAWAPAQAVDIDWGAHGPARRAQRNPLAYFLDTYAFSVGSGSWQIASTAVSNELTLAGSPVYAILGGSYGLYADPDDTPESGDETAVGAGLANFNGLTGALSSLAVIGQGRYYHLVTGLAYGSAGGAYQLSSAVAAVPEPAALALWLAGAAAPGGCRALPAGAGAARAAGGRDLAAPAAPVNAARHAA